MAKHGFAALTPEARAIVSSRGGKSAHAQGKAHTFTSDEARAAGSKGGLASHQKRRDRIAAIAADKAVQS